MAIKRRRCVFVLVASLYVWAVVPFVVVVLVLTLPKLSHYATIIRWNSAVEVADAAPESKATIAASNQDQQPTPIIPEITRFTPHVLELLSSMKDSRVVTDCPNYYELHVDRPMTVPTIVGYFGKGRNNVRMENEWTQLMKRIFSRPGRVLPSNVTFGTTWGDYNNPFSSTSCIGSSSPGGNMTMMNFLNIKEQVKASPSEESVWGNYAIPWDSRNKTPIFRGTGYGAKKDCKTYQSVLSDPDSIRLKAVGYSVDHPTLLNARLSRRSFKAPCWKFNATNGLIKLILVDDIPAEVYYTNYQVALVLGGIGAAFRLGTHLSTGTAVVLQQFKYEEWFTRLLQPHVHYIPVAEDLRNLNETMYWVLHHPEQVQAIATRGRQFYHEFLSFSRNEEHLYEFLFRLSTLQMISK